MKAQGMFDNIKKSVKDWTNEDEIREYLRLILDKKAFDKTGLIMEWDMPSIRFPIQEKNPEELCAKACFRKGS